MGSYGRILCSMLAPCDFRWQPLAVPPGILLTAAALYRSPDL
jgi:hypothetical protein